MNDKCTKNDLRNCQHVGMLDDGSWTIPCGTHYFIGHTVRVGSFSDLADTNHQNGVQYGQVVLDEVKQEVDDLAKDLVEMLAEYFMATSNDLVSITQKLCIYIVDRDHRVLKHGIKLGEERSA